MHRFVFIDKVSIRVYRRDAQDPAEALIDSDAVNVC